MRALNDSLSRAYPARKDPWVGPRRPNEYIGHKDLLLRAWTSPPTHPSPNQKLLSPSANISSVLLIIHHERARWAA